MKLLYFLKSIVISITCVSAQTMEKDFAWLETLGLAETRGMQLKKAETKTKVRGVGVKLGDRVITERYPLFYYGFVIEEDNERIKLLSMHLTTEVLDKNELKPTVDATFEECAVLILEEDELERRRNGELFPFFGSGFFPMRAHSTIVAWLAQKHGFQDLAATLYEHAKKMPSTEIGNFTSSAPIENLTFRQSLEKEVGDTLTTRAIEGFRHPYATREIGDATREELLDKFEELLRNFPRSSEAPFFASAIEILKQMIDEDRTHVTISDAELKKLPIGKQVEELLYRLRDERGELSSDGNCYVNGEELVALSYSAVPYLIDAMDDLRFTRGLRSQIMAWHEASAGRRIVRVGDVAAAALAAISREQFFASLPPSQSPEAGALRTAAAKQKALAWWNRLQKEGEEKILADAVSRGGASAADKADLLARRFPKRAVTAIIEGLEKTQDDHYARERLLSQLANLPDFKVDELFIREARSGASLSCRVYCARQLFKRHPSLAVEAMMSTWNDRDQWLTETGQPIDTNSFSGFLDFLATCNDPAAIRRLDQDFDQLQVSLRYDIVSRITRAMKVRRKSQGYSNDFRIAVFSLLEKSARDDSVAWAAANGLDARVCDPAIVALGEGFTNIRTKTFKEREKDRFRVINHLEQDAGLVVTQKPERLETQRAEFPNRMSSIELRGELVKHIPEWLKPLLDLKGKDLDLNLCCDVIYEGFATNRKCTGKTIAIAVIRHADHTGVHLIADQFENVEIQHESEFIRTNHSIGSNHMISDQSRLRKHHQETVMAMRQKWGKPVAKETIVRLMMIKY